VRGWHGNESVDGKALLAAAALTEVKAPTGVRYYAVDGVHGDDPSAGFSDVSPAEASTRAFKTLGELRAALPAAGGSRKIEITISRGGGVVDGVKLHWPDRVVVVRGAK
jgi:hypothetical protein